MSFNQIPTQLLATPSEMVVKMSPSTAPKAEHGKQSFTQEQLLVDEEKQNGEGEVGDNGVRLT